MPRRVRCRCGQEIVIHHGDAFRILLILVALATLANSIALFVLFGRGEPVTETGTETGTETARAEPRPGRSTPPEGEPLARTLPAEKPEAPARVNPPALAPRTTASEDGRARAAREERAPLLAAGGEARSEEALTRLLEELDLLPTETPPPAPPADPDEGRPSWAFRTEPRLLRFLMLTAEGEPGLPLASLSDPDPVVRVRALELAVAPRQPASEEELRLARPARSWLEREPRAATLLARLTGNEDLPAGLIERIEHSAVAALDALPQSVELKRRLGDLTAGGLDLALLIDVSESMAGALALWQRELGWILPALEWSVPDLRVGLVLYRDEVSELRPFTEAAARELLPTLLGLSASGGGDVPEGVLEALEQSLRLGLLDWRPESSKHVVIVGDQPSRYSEKAAFLSLARAAHREGGFQIHALGALEPGPDAAAEPVAFFADYARAGGGHHATVKEARAVSTALFRCLLGLDEASPFVAERLSQQFARQRP